MGNDAPPFRSSQGDPDERCMYDAQCDDGAFCNGVEHCVRGFCEEGVPPCDDNVDCTIDGCDEATRTCRNDPDDSNCDDGVACTVDICDEAVQRCAHTPDDAVCDDGVFCNGGEICHPLDGCQPGPEPCDTPESPHCDESVDRCVQCLVTAHCDDDAFCNGYESCAEGVCQPGSDPCDDGVICTVDMCEESGDTCMNILDDHLCHDSSCCTVDICDPASIDANADGCRFGLLHCADVSDCPAGAVGCAHGVCLCINGPIPTVTEWGLLVMTLLGLIAGTVVFGRAQAGVSC